jgi:hypothetical protein
MAGGIGNDATETVRRLPIEIESLVKAAKQIVRDVAVALNGYAA